MGCRAALGERGPQGGNAGPIAMCLPTARRHHRHPATARPSYRRPKTGPLSRRPHRTGQLTAGPPDGPLRMAGWSDRTSSRQRCPPERSIPATAAAPSVTRQHDGRGPSSACASRAGWVSSRVGGPGRTPAGVTSASQPISVIVAGGHQHDESSGPCAPKRRFKLVHGAALLRSRVLRPHTGCSRVVQGARSSVVFGCRTRGLRRRTQRRRTILPGQAARPTERLAHRCRSVGTVR